MDNKKETLKDEIKLSEIDIKLLMYESPIVRPPIVPTITKKKK